MNIEKLREPLPISMVDFRVQSVNKGGYATILAYKDARADMNRLDEAVGALNWKREHTNGNHNCIISIWDDAKKEWVSKEDTGAESFSDKEKGLASDSFKRSGFNWGIGRELYSYPVITIKLEANEFDATKAKPTFNFKLKEWVWYSEFTNGELTFLAAKDQNKKVRFKWGEMKVKTAEPPAEAYKKASDENPEPVQEETPAEKPAPEKEEKPKRTRAKKEEPVKETPKEEDEANVQGLLKKEEVVLTEGDAKADLAGEPRPDNPSKEATKLQEEDVEEVEELPLTLDEAKEAGQAFTSPTDMVQWWNENLDTFMQSFTQDEMKGLKASFNEHYQKIK